MLSGKLAASFAQMIIGSDWLNNPGIGMFLGSSTYPVPPQAACPLSMLLGSLPYHTYCWAVCPLANHILKLLCLLLFYLISLLQFFNTGISIYICCGCFVLFGSFALPIALLTMLLAACSADQAIMQLTLLSKLSGS